MAQDTGGANAVDFDADTIKASLVRSSTYTPNQSTDDFYDDVTSPVAEATLANVTYSSAGVVDCDNFTFTAVAAGAACDILVVWKDTGTPATSRLIAKYDVSITPNDEDINVTVNASGLFTR